MRWAVHLGKELVVFGIEDVLPTGELVVLLREGSAQSLGSDSSGLADTVARTWVVQRERCSDHLIFISAKSEDYEHAAQVYVFLTSRSLRAFFSRKSLPELGSSDYGSRIDGQLDQAAHMVAVTSSRERVMSSWVQREWRLFGNDLRGDIKTGNLLTVITGGMQIRDLPHTLRGFEVVPLTDEGMERLLAFVKDPPRSS